MSGVEWTVEERKAVAEALGCKQSAHDSACLAHNEPGNWGSRGYWLDCADRVLVALAPSVAARQSALWCEECGCNDGEGGPTCTCGVCRCASEAEVERLRATVARVEALADALTVAAKIERLGEREHTASLIEALQSDLRRALGESDGATIHAACADEREWRPDEEADCKVLARDEEGR